MIYNNLKELNQQTKNNGRILGLDVGTKTIGVAISDQSQTISNPKLTIARKGNKKDFVKIKELINQNKITAIIIGLPLNMDGSESQMSEFIRKFANNLDQFLEDMAITFFDERLTSFMAEEVIKEMKVKNKDLVDQIAANFILQGAIDEGNK